MEDKYYQYATGPTVKRVPAPNREEIKSSQQKNPATAEPGQKPDSKAS